ncbi:MAG: signal peptide peptidase SppA [Pirellulaceae bacterium]|nr:signal peptide peptidase SppA [Pirellulaceae bacterium]
MSEPQSPTDPSAPVAVATAVERPSAQAPPTVVVQLVQRSGWSRFWSWLGWAGFAFCGLMLLGQAALLSDYFDTSEGIEEKFVSGEQFGSDKVAVITVGGVILEGDGFVKRQIDRVREDENVKAIVVRVDSPGGTVTGSDYMYHHLRKLKEDKGVPLVVSMGAIAASGGYYVAMAVGDEPRSIFAEPTSTTGSIGVIIPHYDFSGLMERFDVKDDSIATHPRKQMLSMTRPMSEDDRQVLQGYIDETFSRFKEIVQAGRPAFRQDPAALDVLATGEIFSAPKAKEHGLIDEIGFLEDAIDRAVELAGLDKSRVRVVKFLPPPSLFSLGGLEVSRATEFDARALLELSTPRAYYLWTSLPPLVRGRP